MWRSSPVHGVTIGLATLGQTGIYAGGEMLLEALPGDVLPGSHETPVTTARAWADILNRVWNDRKAAK